MEDFENTPKSEQERIPDTEETTELPQEAQVHAEDAPEEMTPDAAPVGTDEDCVTEDTPAENIPADQTVWEKEEPANAIPEQPNYPPLPVFEAPSKKETKCPKAVKVILAFVLVAALVAGGCLTTAYFVDCYWQGEMITTYEYINRLASHINTLNDKITQLEDQMSTTNNGSGNSVSGSPNTSVEGMTPSQVYAKTIQGVVSIQCTVVESGISGISAGSGFVYSADGYIITNYHVVEGAIDIKVIDCFENQYAATLVGKDPNNDLAVLKADATGLKPVTIGKSSDLIVGDQVVAIGNALGELSSSLSVGYVSSLDRIVSGDSSLLNTIQADISVNSGNSGGPLFNMKGEVVGIVTIKYSGSTSSGAIIEGIAFAIPTDDITDKIQDIIEYGYVTGPYLGVSVTEMSRDIINYYGLPANAPDGLFVAQVVEGNCAHTAGVKEKDIIVRFGDNAITGLNDLTRALQKFKAGDSTTITVWRNGQEIVLNIVLDEKPPQ